MVSPGLNAKATFACDPLDIGPSNLNHYTDISVRGFSRNYGANRAAHFGLLPVSQQGAKNQYLTSTFLRATAKWVIPGGKNSHLVHQIHSEDATTAVKSAPEVGLKAPCGTRQPLAELQIRTCLLCFNMLSIPFRSESISGYGPIWDAGSPHKLVVTANL